MSGKAAHRVIARKHQAVVAAVLGADLDAAIQSYGAAGADIYRNRAVGDHTVGCTEGDRVRAGRVHDYVRRRDGGRGTRRPIPDEDAYVAVHGRNGRAGVDLNTLIKTAHPVVRPKGKSAGQAENVRAAVYDNIGVGGK